MKTIQERINQTKISLINSIPKEMPKVILCWSTISGNNTKDHFYDTKLRKENPNIKRFRAGSNNMKWFDLPRANEEDRKIYILAGRRCVYTFFHYNNKTRMLAIAVIKLQTTRPKNTPEYKWELISAYYIPQGSKSFYTESGILNGKICSLKYTYWGECRGIMGVSYWLRQAIKFDADKKNFTTNMSKFVGKKYFVAESNSIYQFDSSALWVVQKYFEYNSPNPKDGKLQDKINMLTKIQMPDITKYLGRIPELNSQRNGNFIWEESSANYCVVYEDHQEQLFCLRYIQRRNSYSREGLRIYITNKNKIICCRLTDNGDWVPCTQIKNNHLIGKIINMEEITDSTTFRYIKQIIFDLNDKTPYVAKAIINLVRNPWLEKCAKTSLLPKIINCLTDNSPKRAATLTFGPISTQGNSPSTILGLSNAQMQYMIDNDYNCSLIRTIKVQLGLNSLADLDMNLFDSLIRGTNIFTTVNGLPYWESCGFQGVLNYFNGTNVDQNYYFQYYQRVQREYSDTVDSWGKIYIKICRLQNRQPNLNPTVFEVVKDMMGMYKDIPENLRPNIPWGHLKTLKDYIKMHDDLVQLYNASRTSTYCIGKYDTYKQTRTQREQARIEQEQKEQKQQKQYAKVLKERENWNYEDDDFIIRNPIKLSELIDEGQALSHCVGGYIDQQTSGATSILFLRKKKEPEKPFYTIEVNPENRIVQIHGFGDCWLGNNPEAIPTVLKWIKKLGFICENIAILTSTARGYCSGNAPCVELPQISE